MSYSSSINNSSLTLNDSILTDIAEALDSWTDKILVLETDLSRNSDIQKKISSSLKKQVLDGLIGDKEAKELHYIVDLWTSLHRSYACKKLGVEYCDTDILSDVLELFELKQVTKSFVICIALEL